MNGPRVLAAGDVGRTPRASSVALRLGTTLLLALVACTASSPSPAPPPGGAGAGAGAGSAAAGATDASAAPPPALPHVKMVAGTLSAAVAPLVLAQERGFAQRHGVDIEMFIARSGAEAMAALLSQDAPIGSMSGNAVGNAAASGADLVVLAVNQPRLTYQVFGTAGLRSPSDLRGKRLGVADVGGNSDLAAQYLLEKFGLQRNTDVVVLALGSQNERLGGLQAGAVDAAMLNAPFTGTARKLGYTVLFDYAEEDYEVISGGITTSRSYLQRQPEIVRGVVVALVDAIHYFKTDRAGTIAVIGRFLQLDDPEALEDLYRESAGAALPEKPYPTVTGMTNALAQVVRTNEGAARLNPADLVDDRFVRELDASGYIDALYGR